MSNSRNSDHIFDSIFAQIFSLPQTAQVRQREQLRLEKEKHTSLYVLQAEITPHQFSSRIRTARKYCEIFHDGSPLHLNQLIT